MSKINGFIYIKSVLDISVLDLAVSNLGSKASVMKHGCSNFSSSSALSVTSFMTDSYNDTWEKVWIENLYLIISFSLFPLGISNGAGTDTYEVEVSVQVRATSPPCCAGWHPCPARCSLAPSCKDEKYRFQPISLKYYREVFTDKLGLVSYLWEHLSRGI